MTDTTVYDAAALGQRLERADGIEKVTGQMPYVSDFRLPGMLHAKLLRSPHAHARITSIDVSKARMLPGVRCVLTGTDLDSSGQEPTSRARAVLAVGRVRYHGQPIAAVVADDVYLAEAALELIEVTYEILAAAIDPLDAMEPGAPQVRETKAASDNAEAQAHATVTSTEVNESSTVPTNIASRLRFQRGDVAAGFAESDVIVERTYHVPHVHQSYLEPRAAVATWDGRGNLTVYASTQGQFFIRTELSHILGIPESRIRIVPMEIGGGFGAKIQPIVEPITAILAKKVKRPVKLVLTRQEELIAATPAPNAIIELKTGARRDGTLTALRARVIMDSGSFPGAPLSTCCLIVGGLYRFAHVDIEGIEVLTHKASHGAYRAPGAPHGTFAIESQMDLLARDLKVDRLAFRLRHCIVEGDLMLNNRPWPTNGMKQVLEAIGQQPIWRDRQNRPNRGVGFAIGGWLGAIQPAAANVRMSPDGSLMVVTGAVDLTGTNTAFRQIAAAEIGVSADDVSVRTADSDTAPFAGMSAGSKVIYTIGTAVKAAAADAKRQILDIASHELEVSPADLEIADGNVRVKGAPDRSVSLKKIGHLSTAFAGHYEPVFGRGSTTVTTQSPGFAGQIAEIEVDPETGKVSILRYVSIQDVGHAINPTLIEGQIQGGSAQGIGMGMTEELMYSKEGRLLNTTLLDYRNLTAIDLPAIETVIVEVPTPFGPFGAKGVGEPPIVPGPGAIANAIRDATGCDLTSLPITPEKIVAALATKPAAWTANARSRPGRHFA